MNTVDCESETAAAFPQRVRVRSHSFRADAGAASGGEDTAPGPHDYFDAALASCKSLTAIWYAKRKSIPLERVETHVESDDSEERAGVYTLRVRMEFHGAELTDEHRAALTKAVAACPVHKLMTTADVRIESA